MRYFEVDGLKQKCSQIVMGSMVFSPEKQAFTNEILDAFAEHGGNTIDTAYVYAGGESEKAIGQWFKSRGNRQDIILIDKGGHPDKNGSRVSYKAIKDDVHTSLDRLKEDYIDLYMLHRDDMNVPVSEIMDIMNEFKDEGLFHAIGVSNWSHQRIEEANQYAHKKGIAPIIANSPNLSLAKPNEPRWAGCVSVEKNGLEWHQKSQMPLFSWSSQAGGFFTGRFTPEDHSDPAMVRVYYNEQNWQRLSRARELAKKKNTTAIQIALAYVLHQPFPCAALIGPQSLDELSSSLEGLQVSLTADEVRWLDLLD